MQLPHTGPLHKQLCEGGEHTFHYTQGSVVCELPSSAFSYFGPPPHYRFMYYGGSKSDNGGDIFMRLRDFAELESPEATMRSLAETKGSTRQAIKNALEEIEATIQEHGPFDAVIGYSEGAMLASLLLVEDRRQEEEGGIPRRFKMGVFFCGWPPISTVNDEVLLGDQYAELIDVPTCHVVGANDPFVSGSVALHNLCNNDQLRLFDHGRGHIVPRDEVTVKELAAVIKEMVDICTLA